MAASGSGELAAARQSPADHAETLPFLRDCSDHTVQIADVADTYREMCNDLRDLHFSLQNIRSNEVMKVLTIIATIFIPLGFIAGLYGMNFDHEGLSLEHAGTRMGLWLPVRARPDGHDRRSDAGVLLRPRLAGEVSDRTWHRHSCPCASARAKAVSRCAASREDVVEIQFPGCEAGTGVARGSRDDRRLLVQ